MISYLFVRKGNNTSKSVMGEVSTFKIGVLGGMGPAATCLFYKMITEKTEAYKDQDHINMIIYSDASMPDRTEAILGQSFDDVADKMMEDIRILEKAGCRAIFVTCNTAHFFLDMLSDKIEIPIVHMIDETVKEIHNKGMGRKVAVLATEGTVKTGLYQKRLEDAFMEVYIPEEKIESMITEQIYDRVKKGLPGDIGVWETISERLKEENVSAAIMGCTELSVIKKQCCLPDMFVDPLEILAEKAIVFCGKKVKL